MPRKKTSGIRKTADRQFMIDKIEIINGTRVHIKKTGFASAQEAKEALPAIVEAKRREMNPLTTTKTFDELCRQFEIDKSKKAKPQTVDCIHYMIKKHIVPKFSGLRISDALTFQRVDEWYSAKCASLKDSAERKNKIFTTFRQIIDFAWKCHYITSDAHQDISTLVENVRLPNRAKKDKAVWTYEQEAQFLNSIPKDSIDHPMLTLFCYLGCRLGEFQGLQWRCFNERQGTITIAQQVIRMSGGKVLTEELKTNESYRVNQLDEETLKLLLKYRSTLNSSADDEFIFPSPYNTREPLSKTEFRRRFNKYIELSGVPKIVPHGVRKSKATMIAGVCRNAEEVAVGAKFLGHSPSMFMSTYVSQTGLQQTEIINRLKPVAKA